jgi:hypothetical protein
VISRILALRKVGVAMDTIAKTLNVEGVAARSGAQWYGSTVRNILLREGSCAIQAIPAQAVPNRKVR